jgi:hypothetical protein
MRKYMIAGLGALCAVAIPLGVAASAAAPTVKEQVCGSVPGGIVGVQGLIATNVNDLATVNTELNAARTDLAAKSASLIAALAAHVGVLDLNGDVPQSTANVTAKVSDYSDSAAEWSGLWVHRDDIELQGEVFGLQKAVLENLDTALACPPPTTTTVPASTTTTQAPVTTTTAVPVTTTTIGETTTTTIEETTTTVAT